MKAGDYVKTGDLLAEMADLHRVRVRAFIDEPELGALEPGEPVKISWDALPNRTWSGKTEVIPKQVVARGTRSVGELLCAVDNQDLELLPNINVNVSIHSNERTNVLTVPRAAVDAEAVTVTCLWSPRIRFERGGNRGCSGGKFRWGSRIPPVSR